MTDDKELAGYMLEQIDIVADELTTAGLVLIAAANAVKNIVEAIDAEAETE